jgi:hypothetical protein
MRQPMRKLALNIDLPACSHYLAASSKSQGLGSDEWRA